MQDYLKPHLKDELKEISIPALAHIGDAVFELMVRTFLCTSGTWTAPKLHKKSIDFVSAKSQAKAAEKLIPYLNEDELEIYKRGRNSHTGQTPKNTTHGEYHTSTAIEALFGYLYLCGNTKRLNELFEVIIRKD